MTAAVPVATIPPMPAFRLPLESLIPSKTNPRKTFTAEDIAELAANIKKRGVIQAILARPHPTKPEAFEIVCGERRYRASKEAGLVDVPVDVRALSDEEVLEIQLIENLMRRDLTALEEANGYNAMLAKKYTHERIAEKVGRSVQYVRDRCRLLSLVKGAAELLQAKRIEVGHAILLARLSPEDQIRIIRDPDGANDYSGVRHSGLWEHQRALPMTSEEFHDRQTPSSRESEDPAVTLKAVSVRELAAWIDEHVKLRPDAPEIAELFPEVAAAVKASEESLPGEKPLKVIHITFEHMLHDDVKKVEGPRVYGIRSWVRADGKTGSKTCASSVVGIVVAGPARGEAFQVCIAKKTCQVHYKAEITAAKKREADVDNSGKTGEDRHALEEAKRKKEQKKAAELRQRFERALPAIRLAIAEKCKTATLQKLQAEIIEGLPWDALQVHKKGGDLIPAGKTPEAFIRHLGFVFAAGTLYSHHPNEDNAARLGKKYGVDVTAIIAIANENDAATKAARKKPAKATKGRR